MVEVIIFVMYILQNKKKKIKLEISWVLDFLLKQQILGTGEHPLAAKSPFFSHNYSAATRVSGAPPATHCSSPLSNS